MCESYVHYGIEYNAIMLYEQDLVLYNARLDDRSEETSSTTDVDVACRFKRALGKGDSVRYASVPLFVSVEYRSRATDVDKIRRLKITEPRQVACVLYALRVSGFALDASLAAPAAPLQ